MLWFYDPSVLLFSGAFAFLQGSRATVSTFLLKQASLLGSRQMLALPNSERSTAVLGWAHLRDTKIQLLGLQNTSSQVLPTHVPTPQCVRL